jgi:hypothetical protein
MSGDIIPFKKAQLLDERAKHIAEDAVFYRIYQQVIRGTRVRCIRIRLTKEQHEEEAVRFLVLFTHAMHSVNGWKDRGITLRTVAVHQEFSIHHLGPALRFPWRDLLTQHTALFDEYELADIPSHAVLDYWPQA